MRKIALNKLFDGFISALMWHMDYEPIWFQILANAIDKRFTEEHGRTEIRNEL